MIAAVLGALGKGAAMAGKGAAAGAKAMGKGSFWKGLGKNMVRSQFGVDPWARQGQDEAEPEDGGQGGGGLLDMAQSPVMAAPRPEIEPQPRPGPMPLPGDPGLDAFAPPQRRLRRPLYGSPDYF